MTEATHLPSDEAESWMVWDKDPVATTMPLALPGAAVPISVAIRQLNNATFPITILPPEAAKGRHAPGTPEYRYWTAVEALARGADFWASVVPPATRWSVSVGEVLKVALDDGQDFNAYYDRERLIFMGGAIGEVMIYSGESPDILCHELGHAVLDALRPQLWHAASVEVASFHESFGDISAILCALQLPSVREQVIQETRGRLYRTSRLSRFAEQLGWAMRHYQPDRAEPDCLRNAVNSFFYYDPSQLPPAGPASMLSSEPHLFGRIFTGAFFEAMGAMFRRGARNHQKTDQTPAALLDVSQDAGQLLVDAILTTPVVPAYFSQMAASLLKADETRFGGHYKVALTEGFKRHGILAPEAVASVTAPPAASVQTEAVADSSAHLPTVPIACPEYALGMDTLMVYAASQHKTFDVTGACPDTGSFRSISHHDAAKSFIEDLVRMGRIDFESVLGEDLAGDHPLHNHLTTKSHEAVQHAPGWTLQRRHFDCGFSCD